MGQRCVRTISELAQKKLNQELQGKKELCQRLGYLRTLAFTIGRRVKRAEICLANAAAG